MRATHLTRKDILKEREIFLRLQPTPSCNIPLTFTLQVTQNAIILECLEVGVKKYHEGPNGPNDLCPNGFTNLTILLTVFR